MIIQKLNSAPTDAESKRYSRERTLYDCRREYFSGHDFVLDHINFGGLELTGVRASVVGNQKAPLLLGQTVLKRLGKIEIDNERRVLKITTNQ